MIESEKYSLPPFARKVLIVLGVLMVLSLVFRIWMFAGHRRAEFMYRGHGFPSAHSMPHFLIRGGNGVVGSVSSVALPSFTVILRDGITAKILTASTTVIRNDSGDASSTALTPGEMVVVIGDSNQNGAVDAKFIRVLPPPAPGAPQSPLP